MAFSFEDLKVYQNALDFAVSVIKAIDEIEAPRKHYRLIDQLESCCTSVALNIAEGKGRYSKKEFKQFLYISRGSLFETVAMIQILRKNQWIKPSSYKKLYYNAEELSKMISGLINSI